MRGSSASARMPKPGDAYMTVELTITPTGTSSFVDMIDTHVEAGDGTTYDVAFIGARDPTLPTVTLTPGVTVTGWLTFEVPKGVAGHLTLLYPTSLSTPPVAVALY